MVTWSRYKSLVNLDIATSKTQRSKTYVLEEERAGAGSQKQTNKQKGKPNRSRKTDHAKQNKSLEELCFHLRTKVILTLADSLLCRPGHPYSHPDAWGKFHLQNQFCHSLEGHPADLTPGRYLTSEV